MEEELRNPIYGETKKKHLLQAASLLCLYEKYNLIKDGTMFIEFGAGKGEELPYLLFHVIPSTLPLVYISNEVCIYVIKTNQLINTFIHTVCCEFITEIRRDSKI